MSDRKTVHLHVGCPKTGTSFLQFALRRSVADLAGQGIGFPLGAERVGHVQKLLRPLEQGAGSDAARAAVAELRTRVDEAEEPRQLITLEDLASLPADACDLVVEALSGHDVHVIITARDWSRQLPSQWQQEIKQRSTTPFPVFLDEVRRGEGPVFRSKQHVPGIARRWGHLLPPDQVHVVAVPPSSATEDRVQDLVGSVVGFDPERLTLPGRGINESLGYAQAEALRQVNLALGERLTDLIDYRSAVYNHLMRKFLLRQEDKLRITLPEDHVAWCHEESVRQLGEIESGHYHLVGDTAHLVAPEQPAAVYREPEPEEVTRASVIALADVAASRKGELRAIRAKAEARATERARKAARVRARAVSADRPQKKSWPARRVAGQVARRLGLR